MPKRTKKQKLASQKRLHKRGTVHEANAPSQKAEEPGVAIFKQDFRKSMIIIAFITTLEIITYFGTMYYHSR